MTRAPDVTIVGGGPAGSALAIALGRRGVRVVLYEKRRHPRPKACGEGLLPHGVVALDALVGLPAVPRIRGLRFSAGARVVDADFSDSPGLIVRRDRFDAWLFEHAATTANVDARPGATFKGDAGGVLIGADGARSMFHRRLPGRTPSRRRVGLSTHVLGIGGLGDRVEVFFHDEGELYVASTGGGEALVSALLDYRHVRRIGISGLIEKTPALRARVSKLEHTSPILASAPLGFYVPRIVSDDAAGRLLLVGDAAGTPDPIGAGGLALALSSIRPAADAVVTGNLAAYQQQRLEMGRRANRVAGLLLALSRSERRAASTLRYGAAVIPRVVDYAIRPSGQVSRRSTPEPASHSSTRVL